MIIVTGGAGFIGSNIVKALNDRGISDIIVVDDLEDGKKFRNIVDCDISDYLDKSDFLEKIKTKHNFGLVEAVFHEGACSSTTEWDGKFMMENNFEYTKSVFEFCLENNAAFSYASSAAIYGGSKDFAESKENEMPLNVYGYSKFLFDRWIENKIASAPIQIAGFRYFNVYGPREEHKGSMSSVAFHFNQQIKAEGVCRLFEGSEGYEDGGQLRDFVSVEDVVKVKLWFFDNPDKKGIYNLGTGRAQSFKEVAEAVIDWHGTGEISYISFPDHLKGAYQSYTQADISRLRNVGYTEDFLSVEEGVKRYLDNLNA